MSNILMIYGLLLLLGIAIAWRLLCRYSFEEGLMMSAISIIVLLYVSAIATKSFNPGMVLIKLFGLAGVLLWIISIVFSMTRNQKKYNKKGYAIISFPLICFVGLFFAAILLFYNSFIIHVDELHMWAMLVKKMYELNALPAVADFQSLNNCYVTGLFHLFFQKIAGYSEQNMYVSSFAMMWIGLLLPFSKMKKKDWKKLCLYIAFFYIAIYSLYLHGTRNVYVDLVTITWGGGIAAWWMTLNQRKGKDVFLLIAGCIMLIFAKPYVGLLMAANLIFLVIWQHYVIEQKFYNEKEKRIKVFRIMIPLIILGIAGFAFVTLKLVHQQYGGLRAFIYNDQMHQIVRSFLSSVIGYSLSTKSELKITFFFALFLALFLWTLVGEFTKKKEEATGYLIYTLLWSAGYLMVLLFAYMFIFPRAEALTSEGIRRYISFPIIYNFILVLSQLLRNSIDEKSVKKSRAVLCLLILFFMLGLNKYYAAYNTSWAPEKIKKYDDISKVHKMVDSLNNLLDENDRVYFINQKKKDEYPGNMALFCLEDKMSNYLEDPWYFYEGGSRIRISTDLKDIDIYSLNDILKEGGYTYLWVYHSNNYLKKQFSQLSYCDTVKNNHLYRIVYNSQGNVEQLQSVK